MTISVGDKVENIVGKGESAGCQYFLFFLQCFQKASSLGLTGKRLNLYQTILTFIEILQKELCEYIVGGGENAVYHNVFYSFHNKLKCLSNI